MRMGVFFGGASMSGPAGVADAIAAVERFKADGFFEVAELAFGAAELQLVSVAGDGDAGGIVTSVLQLAQAINNDGDHFFFADITDDATHVGNSRNSICEGAAKLFNHRIGE